MGALFFARHYAHFNVAKVASFQKLLQAHFPEPEPVVRVKLPRLLDIVFEQIQHKMIRPFPNRMARETYSRSA
jgi:hypothetical protein